MNTTSLSRSITRSHSSGFTLLEILMALGVFAILSIGLFLFYQNSQAKAKVLAEQETLQSVARYVIEAYGSVGDFETLSAQRLQQERALPSTWTLSETTLLHSWGRQLQIGSFPIREAHDGFRVTYQGVDDKTCVDLTASMARQVYDARVGGTSVLSDGVLDVGSLGERCSGTNNQVEFIFEGGAAAVGPQEVEPPAPGPGPGPGPLPPPPPPPPGTCTPNAAQVETRTATCPNGFYGVREEERQMTSTCPDPNGLPVDTWGAWGLSSDSCVACPAPVTESEEQWEARSEACGAGFTGTRTWEARQTRQRDVSYACPAGTTALPAPTASAWTSWTDTGERRSESDTCSPVSSGTPGQWVISTSSDVDSSCSGPTRYEEIWSWNYVDGSNGYGRCAYSLATSSVVCSDDAADPSFSGIPTLPPRPPGVQCFVGDSQNYLLCDGGPSGASIRETLDAYCAPL